MIAIPLLAGLLAAPAAIQASAGGVSPRAEAYFNYCLARQAWHRHDIPEAVELLEKAVKGDPTSSDLALELAQLHLDLEDPEQAARAAESAVALSPGSLPALRALATARLALVERDGSPAAQTQAHEALSGLLERAPTDSFALIGLARIDLARGELEATMGWLRALLAAEPDSEEGTILAAHTLTRLRKFDEAVAMLLDAVSRHAESAALRVALVEAHEASGDLEEAILVASRLTAMRADPVRVHYVLARLCRKAGRHAEAYEHWTRIGALVEERESAVPQGDLAEIHARRVEALLDAGRSGEAISLAVEGERRYPADVRFLMRRSEALLLMGRAGEAASALAPALEPGNDPVLRRMASDVYLSAGARHERSGEMKQAERLLRRSIEIQVTNAPALNYLGYMFADRGERLDEAVDLIQRALAQEPDNGAYLDSLGWAHFRRKEYGPAEAALLKALDRMTSEPAVHEHLGELYLATGRFDQAIEALQRAIDSGAERPDTLRERIAVARKAAASTP